MRGSMRRVLEMITPSTRPRSVRRRNEPNNVVVLPVQKDREIEPALGQFAPQAIEHGEEDGVDQRAVANRRER